MKHPKASTKRTKRTRKRVEETKAATTVAPAVTPLVEEAAVVKAPAPEPTPAPLSVRSIAARRSADVKFNKVNPTLIGGKECPRFYPMTWKGRGAFMAKPENADVRERHEAHMKSAGAK